MHIPRNRLTALSLLGVRAYLMGSTLCCQVCIMPLAPHIAGAVKGLGKGLLGAVANPVSGVLDALR